VGIRIAEGAREGHIRRDAGGVGSGTPDRGRREARPASGAAESGRRLDQGQGDSVVPRTDLVQVSGGVGHIGMVGDPGPEQHAPTTRCARDGCLVHSNAIHLARRVTGRAHLVVERDVHDVMTEGCPMGAEGDTATQERAHDLPHGVGMAASLHMVALVADVCHESEEGQVLPRLKVGVAAGPAQFAGRVAEELAAAHTRRPVAGLPRLRLCQRLPAPLHLEGDALSAPVGQDVGAPAGLRVLDVHGPPRVGTRPRDLDLRPQVRHRLNTELAGRRGRMGEVLDARGARATPHLHGTVGATGQHEAIALEVEFGPGRVAQQRGEDGLAIEQGFERQRASPFRRVVFSPSYRTGAFHSSAVAHRRAPGPARIMAGCRRASHESCRSAPKRGPGWRRVGAAILRL